MHTTTLKRLKVFNLDLLLLQLVKKFKRLFRSLTGEFIPVPCRKVHFRSSLLLSFLLVQAVEVSAQGYDVSSATFFQQKNIFSEITLPRGMAFNNDGTKLFIGGTSFLVTDVVYAYDLSTAYDISTATFNSESLDLGDVINFSVTPGDITFKPDGMQLFVAGTHFDLMTFAQEERVFTYNLSTAFDVSTASTTPSAQLVIDTQENFSSGIELNNDGTKLFIIGKTNDKVIEYTMTTAYDITSASVGNDKSVSSEMDFPESMRFSNDGMKLLILETDFPGSSVTIFDYSLTSAFDITTASYSGGANDLSIDFNSIRPSALAFNDDGTKMYVAGTDNTGAPIWEYNLSSDMTAPTVAITSGASDPTNVSPIPVTITFDEDVTGFTEGDLTVGGGTTSNFSGTGSVYTVDVTPSADGTITVDIAAAVAQDAAGNDNDAATQFSIDYDATSPTVTIVTGASDPTNVSPIPLTITFDEDVTGFVEGDLTVSGGTTSNFAGSGSAYTVDVTPSSDGTITVDIATAVAQDAAGNDNDAATQFSIDYDATSPTVTITTGASDPTNVSPISLTITFNEDVTGFVEGDLAVSGGTTSNFAGSGAAYTVDVTPSSDGTITVDLAAAVAQDAAGNDNDAATQFSIDYDATSPTVTIATGASDPTHVSPIPLTITFDEDVTGFEEGDLTVSGGTTSNFAGSGAAYTVDVTPSSDGTITVDIAAAVAQDAAGNDNDAATQFSIDYDATSPTVTIATGASDPTNVSPISLTITFNEDVTGFVEGDLVASGGTTSNFTGTGAVYTVDVTPSSDGTVTVDIAAAVAQDAAGNDNDAATQFSLEYDGTSPTVTIATSASDPTNVSPIPLTITFDEDVTGFVEGDLVVSGGTTSNFAGSGAAYTVDVTPSSDGTITVDIAASVAQDAAGNGNDAATQFSVDYDATSPTATIATGASDPTNVSPIPITITFDEDVTGFVEGDLMVNGGTTSNFAGSGSTYTVDVTPSSDGTITVDIAAAVAQDAAGNDNDAATQFSIDYDTTSPTVTIATGASDPTNLSPITLTITFDEDVTGFVEGDLTVSGGTTSNFAGTGAAYTVDVTPSSDGTITVDLAAAVSQDAAGNGNDAATQFSIDYDATSPTVTIATGASDPTNVSPIPLTITFNEDVTDFVEGDLTVSGGTTNNFSGTGSAYTVDVTPSSDGTITVDIVAAVAQDAAGNGNDAATQFSIDYDATSPTVELFPEKTTTNANTFSVGISFNEDVTGLELSDIVVGNGSAGSFETLSTQLYTVIITPDGNGDITIDVPGASAQDAAGNDNTAAAQAVVTYDVMAPTVDIQGAPGVVNNLAAFSVTFEFSEDANGFELSDIAIGNGSADNFQVTDGNTYSADITPDGNGDVTIDVAAGVAQDDAGNDNTAATQVIVTLDFPPTVEIQGAPTAVNSSDAFSVTFQFNEDVTGFEVTDITVQNGSAGNFQTTDATTYTADITSDENGNITIDVAADVATDSGGNGNEAATQVTIVFDNVAPTVEIQAPASTTSSEPPFSITMAFGEDVTGFELADITVTNGATSNFQTTNASTYTADVTPDGNGDITLDIAAGVAQDLVGNDNVAATQVIVEYNFGYSGGSGTEVDPFKIGNKADLKYLSENSSEWDFHFVQIASITFTSTDFGTTGDFHNDGQGFTPIAAFSGIYDGGDHVIDGLSITRPTTTGVGMFGAVSGGVKNLTLTAVDIEGGDETGGLAGKLFSADVTVAFIENCSVSGSVTGNNEVGGLVGESWNPISNCSSAGDVSGQSEVGGLAGSYFSSGSTLTNSFSTSSVEGDSDVGGLIGEVSFASITNCYSAGAVRGTENVGGLLGDFFGGAINNCFWDTGTSNQSGSSGGGTGKTTAEMKTQSTFSDAGWDFNSIWRMDVLGCGYPIFQQQGAQACPGVLPPALSADDKVSYSIVMYPNPSAGVLHLSSQSNSRFNEVIIITASGKLVKQMQFEGARLESRLLLDDLKDGIYFVTIKGDGESTQRLVLKR